MSKEKTTDAKGAEGTESAEEKEKEEGQKPILFGGEVFDPERAMKTIQAQRESENELKEALAVYKAAEQAEEDAKKSAAEKLVERDARIQTLEEVAAYRDAADSFKSQAEEAGISDPELALLVAKENGLLGDYDPKTGKVKIGKVDFDKLLEEHPVLAGDGTKRTDSGDAGRVGHKTALTRNDLFNAAVRGR